MEKINYIKHFYRTDGIFYLKKKLNYLLSFPKKTKEVNIHPCYIANLASSTNIPKNTFLKFHNLVDEKYAVEMTRKITNSSSFIQRFKLSLYLRVNESDLINELLSEKDLDILNKNLVLLCKYLHALDKGIVDKRLRKAFNAFLSQTHQSLDPITLIYIVSSHFFDQKKYGNDFFLSIEEKLLALKAEKRHNIDRYIDANLKDNSIIFCLINIIAKNPIQDIFWEFFLVLLEKRILFLNLAETLLCTNFLLENRLVKSQLLKVLSLRLVQLCSTKTLNMDYNSYEVVFNNLNLLKILLDLNKLSFESYTEYTLEELFVCLQDSSSLNPVFLPNASSTKGNGQSDIKINSKKDKNKKKAKNPQSQLQPQEEVEPGEINIDSQIFNSYHQQTIEKTFLSNTSIILSRNDYQSEDIEYMFKNISNAIYDENYFNRFFIKKNPFDLFLLIKILAKNTQLLNELKADIYKKIIKRTIYCYFSLEHSLQNRLFLSLNMSLLDDMISILKNLVKSEEPKCLKKKYSDNLIKICFSNIIKNYLDITALLFLHKENNAKADMNENDLEDFKYYLTSLSLQIFGISSLEKDNKKYSFYKDMVITDIKKLIELNFYNKKDIKHFSSCLKKDELICNEIKDKFINP